MGPLTFTRESFNSILYTYTYDRTLYCNILNCTKSGKSGVWVGVSNLIICICAFNSLLIDAFLRRRILNMCIIRVYFYVDLFTVLTRHGIIGVLAPVHRDHTRSPVGCVRHFSRQRNEIRDNVDLWLSSRLQNFTLSRIHLIRVNTVCKLCTGPSALNMAAHRDHN